VATDPRNPYVDFILAEALAAQDAPVESVAALLDKWAALDQVDDTRSAREHRDETEMALAMMTGDFPRVIAAARDQERLRATETSEAQHVEPAMKIISSLEEEGHPDQALRVADDFVRRSPAWTLDDADIRLYQLYARHHAGLVDAPTFRRTLAETQQAEAARLMAIDADGARFWAVVGNADANPLDLELARPYLDHPQSGSFEAVRGHVLLLAGRLDDALPALRSGAATCGCLVTPRTFIQAHLWLGEALEAKGDTAGACTNYAVVIHRWKNAKPRSITLEKAKARSRALHCPAVS
jgi:tetratricopeptide (TPR) repeat protein